MAINHMQDPMVTERQKLICQAMAGCQSLLNVGCGDRPVRQFGVPENTGIELHQATFDRAVAAKTHDKLIHGDVRELSRHFQDKSFDACLCVDVVEHLTKLESEQLLNDMTRIARRVVVVICPVGWLEQQHNEEDDLQVHHSAWMPADLRAHGYAVQGLLGWTKLRGELHKLNYRPRAFWGVVSLLTQQWTRSHPEHAASMFAVKRIG